MFLRYSSRKKDGKDHRYWSIVENKRVEGERVVQRHVLYLGEINSSQELAWRKSIEVIEDDQKRPTTIALFPADRCEALIPDESIVRVRLSELRLWRPRGSGERVGWWCSCGGSWGSMHSGHSDFYAVAKGPAGIRCY